MNDKVSTEVKKDRVHRLLELSNQLEEQYCEQFYGKEIDFLIEEYDDKLNAYKGHSSNYLHAYIPSDVNLKNKIVKIKFTKKNKLDF